MKSNKPLWIILKMIKELENYGNFLINGQIRRSFFCSVFIMQGHIKKDIIVFFPFLLFHFGWITGKVLKKMHCLFLSTVTETT